MIQTIGKYVLATGLGGIALAWLFMVGVLCYGAIHLFAVPVPAIAVYGLSTFALGLGVAVVGGMIYGAGSLLDA